VATVAAIAVTQKLRAEGPVLSEVRMKAEFRPETERSTKICFKFSKADAVDVTMVDRDGLPVRTLADGEPVDGDTRPCFRWDGRTDAGEPAPEELYRLRVSLEDADRVATTGERIRVVREAGR